MGARIELSEGNWAELRPVGKVHERARMRCRSLPGRLSPEVLAAYSSGDQQAVAIAANESDMETFFLMNAMVAVALIREWSFDFDVTLDNLLDLVDGDDYDTLTEATAKDGAALLQGVLAAPDPEARADSPT
jgi:hypothetical protein